MGQRSKDATKDELDVSLTAKSDSDTSNKSGRQ